MSAPFLTDQDSFWDRSARRCGVITSVYQLTVQGPWFYKFRYISLMEPDRPYLFHQERSIVSTTIDDAINRNQYVIMKDSNKELFTLLKALFDDWGTDVQER